MLTNPKGLAAGLCASEASQPLGILADLVSRWPPTSHRRQDHPPEPYPRTQGVRGRNSDNRPIQEMLGRSPSNTLRAGLEKTYGWIEQQTMRNGA